MLHAGFRFKQNRDVERYYGDYRTQNTVKGSSTELRTEYTIVEPRLEQSLDQKKL